VSLSTGAAPGRYCAQAPGKPAPSGRWSGTTINGKKETTMLKKPLAIAAIAIATTAVLAPTEASAGDPGLGALLGGAVGAAIGHNVNGHHGAVVGGVLGAITGASIAANSGPYYGPDYGYAPAPAPAYAPAPVYYAPPAYYRPAPVYYAPPVVVRPRPVYVHHGPRRPVYAPVVVERPPHWRNGGPYRY